MPWPSNAAPGSSARAPSIASSAPAARPESRFKTHLVLATAFAGLLLSERMYLRASTGGRGLLPLMEFVIPVVAAYLLWSRGGKRIAVLARERQFAMWAPCCGLMVVLPLLAVLAAGQPVRLIMGSLAGIRILSFLAIGAWIGARRGAVQSTARKYLVAAVVVEFGMAALQYATVYGPGPIALFKPLYDWDQATQFAYSSHYVINGRSIGTFVNPNSLGFASVLAFWSAAFVLRGAARRVCVPMALATAFFSQSRGSTFALAAGAILWTAYLGTSTRRSMRAAKDLVFFVFLSIIPAVAWGIAGGQAGAGGASPILARFERGLMVISEGADADRNFGARVDAWQRAFHFYQSHPLGTWIEPQFLFGGYIDNDYVRLMLQGSVPLVFAFVLALYGGMRLMWRSSLAGRVTALFAAGVAVNSISATPLMYSVMGAYWLAGGFYLAATAGGQGSLGRPGTV